MTQLPIWLTGEVLEAWEEYVAQRKRDKKPMTPRSMKGRLDRLEALIQAGHDPVQCIDEAINAHWLDFYAPKDKTIERAPNRLVTQEYDDFNKRQREAQAASQTPEAIEARRRAVQSIKRVA